MTIEMNDITLSVTVLSYNNEHYIEECLSSIVKQGIEHYEVFIVDDCSTDRSVCVIKEFIESHPQFVLIEKETNSGGAVSSQIGIARSTGKYCAIVDSDDIVADGAYKRLIKRIEEDDSDFAAGMALKLSDEYIYDIITETKIFSANRVLSDEDKVQLTSQVNYWNCIYRTEFIKENNIIMPEGLLSADRIYLFNAIYKARRISIDQGVVYYWRKKGNIQNLSITDKMLEFSNVSDRCESFEAQIRLTLQNMEDQSALNMGVWEHSLKRLFYPFKRIYRKHRKDSSFEIEETYILKLCERYRILLYEYRAFFLQLLDVGKIDPVYSFYLLNILNNKYERIIKLLQLNEKNIKMAVEKIITTDSIPSEMNLLSKVKNSFIVKGIIKEGNKKYVYIQSSNALTNNICIDRVIAISTYYRMNQFDITYDRDNNRFDISCLPETTYNFYISYTLGNNYYMKPIEKSQVRKHIILYEDRTHIVKSSGKGGNPLTIIKKNQYCFIESKGDTLIYMNQQGKETGSIFFFNDLKNERIELDQRGDNLYVLRTDTLPRGKNVLISQNAKGIYALVDKAEFCNTAVQMNKYNKLFIKNRIEINIQ